VPSEQGAALCRAAAEGTCLEEVILKARRRVSAVASMTLGMVLLAGPAKAVPINEFYCKKGGVIDVDVEDSSFPTSVDSPQVGLLNLTNSLNNVLSDSFKLFQFEDSFKIEDVKLIENINLLSSASAAASCR
jgi:hypothetical protein